MRDKMAKVIEYVKAHKKEIAIGVGVGMIVGLIARKAGRKDEVVHNVYVVK